MDIATGLGLLVGAGALVFGYSMDGGSVAALWLLSAFIIVLGGSIGSISIAFGFKQVAKMPVLFLQLFKSPKSKMAQTLDYLVLLAENARRDGLLSLEKILNKEDPKKPVDPLLKHGMLMVIDGADMEQIKDYLETEVYVFESRVKTEISTFETLAGYAPAYGMIGTIMGLIQVLANMESPEQMASAIAVAFITTLYGVILANLICLPAANKMSLRLNDNLVEKEMIVEGICSIRNGQNPKMLREKLSVYLPGDAKSRQKAAGKNKNATVGKEEVNAETGR